MFTTGRVMKSVFKPLLLGPRAVAAGVLLAGALVQPPAWAEVPVWQGASALVSSIQSTATACTQCGVVETVTPVQRDGGSASGLGAAAGAVLGGWLANQFGNGDGKNLATILGMLGGTWAGNMLEKQFRQDTSYRIDVRMADGSLRSVDHASALPVGSAVRVDGNSVTLVVPSETDTPNGVHTSV
jgi:outer membrane lipoprotein SlyB